MPPPWESYSSSRPPPRPPADINLSQQSSKKTSLQSSTQRTATIGVNEIVDGVGKILRNVRELSSTPVDHIRGSNNQPYSETMNRANQPATRVQPQGQITGEGYPTFKLAGSTVPQQTSAPKQQSKRWTIDQLRATDAMIPSQMGTNQFASQKGMTGFGQPRLTATPVVGGVDNVAPEPVIPLQYGTNQFASQKGMTGFGCPRDVGGKHLHRLWEIEYPEHAHAQLDQAVH